jgi:protein-tyrosine phosphatase
MQRGFRRVLLATLAFALPVASSARADTTTPEVQPTVEDGIRNVQLRSVRNVRDLGGLRGRRGIIPHERFFRAATLAAASGEDREALLQRGVTLDIDLRTFFEAAQRHDRLSSDSRFSYRRFSLVGAGLPDLFRNGGLRGLYVHVLASHQSPLRDIFHAMAVHDHGAVLYHCTSGKDRTGMVTAILLDLAGVDRETIVHDYALSAHYLGRSQQASPAPAIAAFLAMLDSRFGGSRAFLAHIGLPEAEIRALLVKLGQA